MFQKGNKFGKGAPTKAELKVEKRSGRRLLREMDRRTRDKKWIRGLADETLLKYVQLVIPKDSGNNGRQDITYISNVIRPALEDKQTIETTQVIQKVEESQLQPIQAIESKQDTDTAVLQAVDTQ